MTHLRRFIAAVLMTFAIVSGAQALTIYDASTQFSFASNPADPWSYGFQTTLGGNMTLYSDATVLGGVQFWRLDQGGTNTPNVGLNPTGNDITFASTTWRPGEISLHPGPGGEFSVVRFTPPDDGRYTLDSLFEMRSFGGTSSTDVHVLLNGVSLFDSGVSGFTSQTAFSAELLLSASDQLDFVVGAAGSFLGDTTRLHAELTAVPVPAAVFLFSSAFAGLGLFRRRRA